MYCINTRARLLEMNASEVEMIQTELISEGFGRYKGFVAREEVTAKKHSFRFHDGCLIVHNCSWAPCTARTTPFLCTSPKKTNERKNERNFFIFSISFPLFSLSSARSRIENKSEKKRERKKDWERRGGKWKNKFGTQTLDASSSPLSLRISQCFGSGRF